MKKEIKPFFCTYCDKQVPCGCDKKFHLQEPIKEDWEKRFDDNTYQWEESGCAEESSIIYWDKIKSFIRQLLTQQKQKWDKDHELLVNAIIDTYKMKIKDLKHQYRQEILEEIEKEIKSQKIPASYEIAHYKMGLEKAKELINKDE